MQLAVLGLNHNTAPVEIREKLVISDKNYERIYAQILQNNRIYEVLILSTCNRVEYYIVTDDFLCNVDAVLHIVATESNIDPFELKKYTYIHCGLDAVKHIFKVASGLDSLVLGEPQIFGQVKDAFDKAKIYGKFDTFLNKLEEFTIRTSKKVRTNTKISENPVSVSYAAVELAKKIFNDLSSRTALIIGAGEMCELAAKHLEGNGIKRIFVTNRTFERALQLAKEVNGEAVPIEKFVEYLKEVDIVISSTGAPNYMVTYEMIKNLMHIRKYEPMFFIDIAVPRDIDPKINELENTFVYDIDDLKDVVEANKKQREKEALKALEIIKSQVVEFDHWLSSTKIIPIIKQLRQQMEDMKNNEIQRMVEKLKINDPQEVKKIDAIVTSYMNKILHNPIMTLKDSVKDKKQYTIAEAVRLIFDIKE
ncbi:glutamyl-tRNA reductase [Calditerrivibrio sp.]|uniref:glutamyl-tRNA reductase n=1 Tax=Calditerrivibrio sp. TaxID=2792612 RepID=UPI003D0E3BC0